MEAFSATLQLDPTLLQGLRHSLAAWLESAGAPIAERNSVLLATHEVAAHAMQTGRTGGTVDVTATTDGLDAFVVHVRSDGVWERVGPDTPWSGLGLVAGLMGDVSTQASHTVRMRSSVS